jgi:hypothetical protein
MKTLLFFIVAFYCSLQLYATAQIPDILIYKGDTLALFSNPLEDYPDKTFTDPQNLFGDNGCFFSACWRNYIATWEIIDDNLYLTQVRNACYPTELKDVAASYKGEPKDIGNEYADLKRLFPKKYKDGKVKADWVTANIIAPQGNLLYYVHDGYASSYEKELELQFKKGKLISIKTYDNSKTKQSVYSQDSKKLLEWIENSIEWSNLPDFDYGYQIRVVLRFSANENGIIDNVDVIKGYEERFEKEAVRVVKSIPEWDIYYRHGKHERKYWNIPISFSELKKKKYAKKEEE